MSDVDDIIDYIKSLKKGFDKDLFQNKIDELGHVVDTDGLEYNNFHILFKVWLNLSIPITKWVSLGACLVPKDQVMERTVEYALRWLLANHGNQTTFSRIGFLLDWLTAAMDCNSIDMTALDNGYELFYAMLTYDGLTPHSMKLVYNLTKPADVTRRRVLELLDYAKKVNEKQNLYRQLQVLLGLFKSYKPEYVPEDIPSISIHTAFKKINATLLNRFKMCQNNRNSPHNIHHHLLWTNLVNCEPGRNKKADPLVPNMEFFNIGSKQYEIQGPQKNYFDFSDPVSLLEYSMQHVTSRPARFRSLLCNASGLKLLALASDTEQAFFSHDLHHLLTNCFLDVSPYSYTEKRDLLQKLATLQRTIVQGIPVVSRFLAQFLPFWNEKDFFAEILDLVEWISVDCSEHITSIMESLMKIYYRAQPMEQCAILKSLSAMYANLVYSSTRKTQHFTSMQTSKIDYPQILHNVTAKLTEMYDKGLQINPDDMRVLWSVCAACERCVRGERACGRAAGGVPRAAALALPLLCCSAALLDCLAALVLQYRKIFSFMKSKNAGQKSSHDIEQLQVLKAYTSDMVSCLYNEDFLSCREDGYIFSRLRPQTVAKLAKIMPDVDAKLSIRNHLAFAPYTYAHVERTEFVEADNNVWFNVAIRQQFGNLSEMLMKADPQ